MYLTWPLYVVEHTESHPLYGARFAKRTVKMDRTRKEQF